MDHDIAGMLYSVSESRERHSRAVFLRIYLPLIICAIGIVAILLLGWGAGQGARHSLANLSAVLLALMGILVGWVGLVGCFFLALLIGHSIYLLPMWTGRVRPVVALVSFRIRKISDGIITAVDSVYHLTNQMEQKAAGLAYSISRLFRRMIGRY